MRESRHSFTTNAVGYKFFGELSVGKGRQRLHVLVMNPMVVVLRRNIASLIRIVRSVKLRHPMDSRGLVNTSGGQQSEMDSTAPGHSQAASIMEQVGDEGAASMMPKTTADQPPVAQEKKKQRQFDFSMSVS